MSEIAIAQTWIVSTLNNDPTIQAQPSYDATLGLVWDSVPPPQIKRPFFMLTFLGGNDVNTAQGGHRVYSGPVFLLKAVGESSQYDLIQILDNRANYLLMPKPDGANMFPVASGSSWILSCERTAPHQLSYNENLKRYTELGGFWATQVKQ
jgi:hypothetical protein